MSDTHKHRLSHTVTADLLYHLAWIWNHLGGMSFVTKQIFVEKELTEERELTFDVGNVTTGPRLNTQRKGRPFGSITPSLFHA